MKCLTGRRAEERSRLLGLGAGALFALSRVATASDCPPDKLRLDGSGQQAVATMPKDVTDAVLATLPLVEETEIGVSDRLFRLHRLEADRLAIIYIVQGEITEYRSLCAVPVVRKAGDAISENHLVSHWWKNTGSDTAVVLSADLFRNSDRNGHMM